MIFFQDDRAEPRAIINYANHFNTLLTMGDSKRRKETLGEKYGQEPNILPWIPISKTQATQFVKWSTRGAWVGIGLLVIWWITVRFLGPAFGWWQVS